MKFGVLGDLHLRSDAPTGRMEGDYFMFQKALVLSICTVFRENGCDAILLPGDVINKRRTSNDVICGLIEIVNESGLPWFTTVGQHDVLAKASETYVQESDLRVVEKACSGLFTVLTHGDSTVFNGVSISGFASGDKELDDLLLGKVQAPRHRGPKIALLHAPVSDIDHGFIFPLDKVPGAGFDVQIHGDIHEPFRTQQIDECLMVSIGVLTWQNRREAQSFKCARYGILEVSHDSPPSISIKRRAHPAPEEVFDMSEELTEADVEGVEETIQALKDARDAYGQVDEKASVEEVTKTLIASYVVGDEDSDAVAQEKLLAVAALKEGLQMVKTMIRTIEEESCQS